MPSVTSRDEPWSVFPLWHHHLWPKLALCILIMYTQKIFSMVPRSEWLAQWDLIYTRKCSEVWTETLRAKFPATTSSYSIAQIARQNFFSTTGNKPSRRLITAAKEKKRQKRKRDKKIKEENLKSLKKEVTFSSTKIEFCAWPVEKCPETGCWYKEKHAVMLSMPFWVDWT